MVEYLSIDALSFMAISGDSFCKSAWLGFLIDIKHLFDFWLARAMGPLFLFYGLLANVAVSVGCFVLISKKLYPNAELNQGCMAVGSFAAVISGTFLIIF